MDLLGFERPRGGHGFDPIGPTLWQWAGDRCGCDHKVVWLNQQVFGSCQMLWLDHDQARKPFGERCNYTKAGSVIAAM
jgi:hypothetical protein